MVSGKKKKTQKKRRFLVITVDYWLFGCLVELKGDMMLSRRIVGFTAFGILEFCKEGKKTDKKGFGYLGLAGLS